MLLSPYRRWLEMCRDIHGWNCVPSWNSFWKESERRRKNESKHWVTRLICKTLIFVRAAQKQIRMKDFKLKCSKQTENFIRFFFHLHVFYCYDILTQFSVAFLLLHRIGASNRTCKRSCTKKLFDKFSHINCVKRLLRLLNADRQFLPYPIESTALSSSFAVAKAMPTIRQFESKGCLIVSHEWRRFFLVLFFANTCERNWCDVIKITMRRTFDCVLKIFQWCWLCFKHHFDAHFVPTFEWRQKPNENLKIKGNHQPHVHKGRNQARKIHFQLSSMGVEF